MVYVDCFSQPFSINSFQNLPISTKVPNTYSLQEPKKLVKVSNDGQNHLNQLLVTIAQQVEKLKMDNSRTVIIIDDISSLMQGCDSQNPDLDFLEIMNYLINL